MEKKMTVEQLVETINSSVKKFEAVKIGELVSIEVNSFDKPDYTAYLLDNGDIKLVVYHNNGKETSRTFCTLPAFIDALQKLELCFKLESELKQNNII